MKKRLISLLLAACLLLALCALPAAAASEEDAVRTVQALGIMVGDENGNMNLGQNVTRAQFAKLLAASSRYKDSVGEGAGYSLYKDVKSGYWASEYIRLAAEQGWMTGYTDGTFRPDGVITLEEACAATLRLLGYDSSVLAGSYPYAQLNKASALGLRDGVSRQKGELMLRSDCAKLFYNALTAETPAGQVYALTLGYSLTADGEVDYAAALRKNLSGPYIAGAGTALGFTPLTVYRDGKAAAAALKQYDVYYYNADIRTLWIYTERVSGKIDALTPSSAAPTSVTVAGKSYAIGSAEATYKLSALGGGSTDRYVTLLLGMDDAVAGVLTGGAVDAVYYGVVTAAEKSAAGDSAYVENAVSVFCTDGAVRSFVTDGAATYTAGRLVSVTVTDGGSTIKTLTQKSLAGRVDAAATRLGDYALADGIRIIDTDRAGGLTVNAATCVKVERERLAESTLEAEHVLFYSLDPDGKIDNLILKGVTGDTWTYGVLYRVDETKLGTESNFGYAYVVNGVKDYFSAVGTSFPATTGGVMLRYDIPTLAKSLSMRSLSSVRLTEIIGASAAMAGNRKYLLAEDAQVYLRADREYYLTDLSSVDAAGYTLTGWYDSIGCPAGGLVRVVVAVKAEAADA